MKDNFIRRAVVIDVYDGDSITVNLDLGFGVTLNNQKIRLARIDTPELKSNSSKRVYKTEKALGLDIQQWLEELLMGKEIFIKSVDYEPSFSRLVGEIYVYIDDNMLHLNQYMIDHGIAREYHDNSSYPEKWNLKWYNETGKKLFLEWKQTKNPAINIIK